ncbi:MAG: hypothetical protein O3A91_06935 [Proteobacteria bacterium]|nr:hypothetical protein [Pseudomonadota bacterium]
MVPADLRSHAYRIHPLPIEHGQTISQPYIVALSADLIAPAPHLVVLEVGPGWATRRRCCRTARGSVRGACHSPPRWRVPCRPKPG